MIPRPLPPSLKPFVVKILKSLPICQSANTLEKVGHQYHMQEIYKEAAVMYREMVEKSSLDPQVCSCANDILDNGVLDQLVIIAKSLNTLPEMDELETGVSRLTSSTTRPRCRTVNHISELAQASDLVNHKAAHLNCPNPVWVFPRIVLQSAGGGGRLRETSPG